MLRESTGLIEEKDAGTGNLLDSEDVEARREAVERLKGVISDDSIGLPWKGNERCQLEGEKDKQLTFWLMTIPSRRISTA